VFELPVRVTQAGQIQGVLKPEFVSAAGMIRYIASVKKGGSRASEIKLKKQEKQKNEESLFERIINFFKKIF
jgi:cell division ATPase FtsA